MARLKNLTDRGQETQQQLTDVLMELALEKGFEAVTVKDITERAGIDRSTFYLHFKDKYELLVTSQQRLIDDLVARIQPGDLSTSGVAVAFAHMAEHVNQYRVLLQLEGVAIPSHLLHEYIMQTVQPIIEQRLQENGVGTAV